MASLKIRNPKYVEGGSEPLWLDLRPEVLKVKKIIENSGDVTKIIEPNKYYEFGEVNSLTITLNPQSDGYVSSYLFLFTSGLIPTVLTLPSTIKWLDDNILHPESNKIYQVSIYNNIAIYGSCSV